jgi:hypothetical protein
MVGDVSLFCVQFLLGSPVIETSLWPVLTDSSQDMSSSSFKAWRSEIHFIDPISYQTQSDGSVQRWLPNSIIVANKFSIFRQTRRDRLFFSKKRDISLSLMLITSMLTRTWFIRACLTVDRSHHHQKHFHTQTYTHTIQAQLERIAAIQLSCPYGSRIFRRGVGEMSL